MHFSLQLSRELGFPIVANAQLTFTKCLEMKLQDHIEVIAKVAEIAGKEYSIEQVNCKLHIHIHSSVALESCLKKFKCYHFHLEPETHSDFFFNLKSFVN